MNPQRPLLVERIRVAVVERLGSALGVFRQMTPPAALSLLLVLAWAVGGSSRANSLQIAILELVAIACVALVLALRTELRFHAEARWPVLLLAAFFAVACFQLIPLPWQVWAALPGHGTAAEGLRLLGLEGGFRSLSLAPENTVSGLLNFIPPAAAFLIAILMPWRMLAATLRWTVIVIAVLSTVWGIGQVLGLAGHLDSLTHPRAASGSFANVNHQGSLLLMCLPLMAASAGLARQRSESGEGNEIALVWASAGFIVLIGIALAGSMFGYLLAPFVIAASMIVSALNQRRVGWRTLSAGFLVSLVALAAVFLTAGLNELGADGRPEDARSRSAIYATTTEAIVDYAPFGSGLGTFEKVYPLYENDENVPSTFVNHAHNEYLQLALELGVPGMLVVVIFVLWLGWKIAETWVSRTDYGSLLRIKKAASIALCVPVLHSIIDYPLRSPAVATLAAACLAVLIARRERSGAPATANPAQTSSTTEQISSSRD